MTGTAAVRLALLAALFVSGGAGASAGRDREVAGLWEAHHRLGPEIHGEMIVRKRGDAWIANIAGQNHPMMLQHGVISFDLPGGRGGFRARLTRTGIQHGQWFQPSSSVTPAFASSVSFAREGRDQWRGHVRPVPADFSFYLLISRRPDGSLDALIRNPQRNIGRQLRVDGVVRDAEKLTFIGREPGGKTAPRFNGRFNEDGTVISVDLGPAFGGTYDFTRATEQSAFYPRGKAPADYVYTKPLKRKDGWAVGSLDGAGISRRGIEAFLRRLLSEPMEAPEAPQVDALLIARHGKLVVEEYFHGWDRDTPHNTRSAGKSVTAALIGSAIHAGAPLALSSKVYDVMGKGATRQDPDPLKSRMTLEHLLTMSSGFYCNDSNPEAPGNEETMLSQSAEPDFYRYTLRVPMDRTPGEKSVYCSADANLALGMLNQATGEHPMDLFERLIARPLQITQSAWYLSPSRQPYGGGSLVITPRDFLKIGQTMLDGGRWKGRRILDEDFVKNMSSPLHPLKNIHYGYLWWSIEWPYKGRSVRAFFAGGNGGQAIIVIPELDLVIGTFGSSYSSPVGLEIQQAYVPRYILPSVDFSGADLPPIGDYKVIYGLSRP